MEEEAMAKLINKVLNFVGWESEEEEVEKAAENKVAVNENKALPPQLFQSPAKKQQGKVVNIHSNSQFKVIITQPESIEDARVVCDHLKNNKTVVVNLEEIPKEMAQRIIDFLSGSIYALDGDIQKASAGIFVVAPNNVDLTADMKEDFKNKVFPWLK